METLYKTNKYQTKITDELLNSLPKEVSDDLFEYINSVPFIQNLISPKRKRARDLPRDKEGKIIIDLSNPHILEDMDYFRESAIHFQKHGCYTKLRVNSAPQSEYIRWLKREVDRIWNGMIREKDGEWITGDLYFYLNYFPIIQTQIFEDKKFGIRIVDFPEVWEGVYWRFHYMHQARFGGIYNNFTGGQHGTEIARRGCSKSYSMAAVMVKYFLLGIDSKQNSQVKSMALSYNKEYLIKDGLLNKFIDGLNFCNENTEFPSRKLKNSLSEMHWQSGWLDDDDMPNGTRNEVLGMSIADDIDKVRGKRQSLMIYEEFGAFPKYLDVWQVALPNIQEGEYAFGFGYSIGTGGSEGTDFQGAMEMILNPIGYNIYGIPNVYDKGSSGQKRTIFFYPGYVNTKGYYNKDGVSDVIGAMISELKTRFNLKYNSTDPLQLTRRKAEYAFTLQDAVMRRDNTIYPVADLIDRINQLDNNTRAYSDMYVAKFDMTDGKVIFKPDRDTTPITKFPHKDNKVEGAIHIYRHPELDSSKKPFKDRYISGIDTFDDDESQTTSLFACYILDLWTDELVAEYVGRPMFADDAYENARRLLLYYDARCNYENNKKGLYRYFAQHSCDYLLTDTLDFLMDKDMMTIGRGNKKKGTLSTLPIKNYSRRCIRDWLLKPVEIISIEDGEEVSNNSFNLFKIKFRALLEELSQWSPERNCDRHDALAMLMLLREDRLRLIGDDSFEGRNEMRDKNDLSNDEFFMSYKDSDDLKITKALMDILGIKEENIKNKNTSN